MPDVDLSSAARFLDALAGTPSAPHTFIVFPEGGADVFPKIRHGTLLELADLLKISNGQGAGISVTVSQGDGEGRLFENMLHPRAAFLDLDPPQGSELERVQLPNFGKTHWPSAVVRTRRGYHCYWWLDVETSWERWEALQAALARRFEGDPQMTDRTKALRVPGFWHNKLQPPYLVELVHLAEEPRYHVDELADAFHIDIDRELELARAELERSKAPRQRPSRYDPAKVSQIDRVEQYRRWVNDQPSAVQGQNGHKALVRIIKMAWNFGIEPLESALPVVEDFNARCDPPWNHRELLTQFRSATRRGRFDPNSWESMVWVPEPTVERREGPQPEDDVPLREPGEGVRKTITVNREPPPDPPMAYADGPPHPAEAESEPTATIRITSRGGRERGSGGHGGGGGDHGGGGRGNGPEDEELGWHGPPVNGHRVLSKESPLESARMFVRWRHVAGDVKTIGTYRRAWYRWNGQRHEQLSIARVNKTIYAFASPAQTWITSRNGRRSLVDFNPDESKVNKIRHALESLTYLDDAFQPPCWIAPSDEPQPPPKEIVACRNGLLHLPTMRLLGPRPDFFNFTALGVDYDPNAPTPTRWLRFLEELWEDDRESQQLLQEWFGLCLVQDTSYQKALLIVGPKRCGKGTIARTLNRLHGEHNSVAWPSLSDLISRFGLSTLLDKTIAIIPDLRVSNKIDTAAAVEMFLKITGEDWVQVDRKNLDVIPGAQLPVRFLIMSNEAPRLPDPSGAFASRILALRCVDSWLGKEDLELEQKLADELPGILLWAIEGWRRLTERGRFVQPGFARELVEDITELSSPVQAFVADRCTLDDLEASTGTDELFVAWRKWCDSVGRSAVGEKSTFIRNLRAAFPKLQQHRPRASAGNRMRALLGIALLPDDERPSSGRRGAQQSWLPDSERE